MDLQHRGPLSNCARELESGLSPGASRTRVLGIGTSGARALQVSKALRPITAKPVVAIVPDRVRLWTDSVHQGRPHGPRKIGKAGRLHGVWADAGGRAGRLHTPLLP